MPDNARIRINIYTGEIEFEGNEDFVTSQLANLTNTLNTLKTALPPKEEVRKHKEEQPKDIQGTATGFSSLKDIPIPDNFGEWFNEFPKSLQQNEYMLIAAYYQQRQSSDNTIKTIEANRLLIEQGTKVANAALCMTRLKKDKYVIKIGTIGKKISKFRVSKDGEAYLFNLINQ